MNNSEIIIKRIVNRTNINSEKIYEMPKNIIWQKYYIRWIDNKGITSTRREPYIYVSKEVFLDLVNGVKKEYKFETIYKMVICLAWDYEEAEEVLFLHGFNLSHYFARDKFYLDKLKKYCKKKNKNPLDKIHKINDEFVVAGFGKLIKIPSE